ncbi:MAG TPA: PAS domain-containing protein [Thermoanaerobaculia bacterium]|nr:PAS domain-containing protein [Thermoanaerobaculia bacterium]
MKELVMDDAFLASVLVHVAVGISVQDASGQLIWVNEVAARQLGIASRGAMGASTGPEVLQRYEMLDAARHPITREELPGRRALRGEAEPEALVCYREVGSGNERWSMVKSRPILDERGKVTYAVNTWYDVTDLKS